MKEMMPLSASVKEINDQAKVVKRVLKACMEDVKKLSEELNKRNIKNLILLGSGDSFYAGMCAKLAFETYAGTTLNVIQAYEYASFGSVLVDDESAVIVISSSGRMSTTRDALYRAKESGAYIIGMTDNEFSGNPFIEMVDFSIVSKATKEGWPTQTTNASLILLIGLSIFFGYQKGFLSEDQYNSHWEELEKIPAKIQSVLECCEKELRILGHSLNQQNIIFVGSGPGYGVANIGTALMAEGSGKISPCFYIEEIFHALRTYALKPGDLIVLVAPEDSSVNRYRDLVDVTRRNGAYLISIISEEDEILLEGSNLVFRVPSVPAPMSALLTMVVLHKIAIAVTEKQIRNGFKQPDFRFN